MFRIIDVEGDAYGNCVKFQAYRPGSGAKGATGEFIGFEHDDGYNWIPVIISEKNVKIRESGTQIKNQVGRDGEKTGEEADSEVESETGADESLENFSDNDENTLPNSFLFSLIKKTH